VNNYYVVFYELAEDARATAPPAFPAHAARLRAFRDRGTLLMAGTFADLHQPGSMLIFRTREAAEEFVKDDPFVLKGVVRTWIIREWHEVSAEL
jgi:uncharacterized protein YciI